MTIINIAVLCALFTCIAAVAILGLEGTARVIDYLTFRYHVWSYDIREWWRKRGLRK